MKKLIITIIFFPVSILIGMDEIPQIKTLIWNNQSYNSNAMPEGLALFDCLDSLPLKNLTVLDDDGIPEIAEHVAKTAHMVHSDTTWRPDFNQDKSTNYKSNIIFRKPQENTYDIITVSDKMLIKNISRLRKTFRRNRFLLKETGNLFVLLQTSENKRSIQEETIIKLYPELYEAISPEKKELVPAKAHPNIIKFYGDYSREDIERLCESTGYEIASYRRKIYNVLIDDMKLYRKSLKYLFLATIKNLKLSSEHTTIFQELFINRVIDQLPKDHSGHPMYPVDITELQLRPGTIPIRIKSFFPLFNPQ